MKAQEKDDSLKWYILTAVMTGGFMASVDGSIVSLILPTLADDFNAEFAVVQWVLFGYLLSFAALILIFGRIGDTFGRKRVYLTGFILFTIGSVLCGFSVSISWLIGFRVLQGVGGAMILALGFAIATQAFPASERGKALGILASVVSMGMIAGPVAGGFFISFLSWHWIFFINLPIGIVGIFMVAKYVPDNKISGQRGFDYKGAVILFVCILSMVTALTLGQISGFRQTRVLILLLVSLITILLFTGIELKTRIPMIDLRIFRNSTFSVNLTTTFVVFFTLSGVFLLAPFYFQHVLEYPGSRMGFLFAAMSLMMVLFSPAAGMLSDRFESGVVIAVSLLIMLSIYCCVILELDSDATPLECLSGMIILGSGMGLFMSPNHSAIMGAIPARHLGMASGLVTLARTLGQIAGVSLSGALWAAGVRFHSGAGWGGNILHASAGARIEALRDIFAISAMVTAVALMLNIVSMLRDRKNHIALKKGDTVMENEMRN